METLILIPALFILSLGVFGFIADKINLHKS